MGKRIVYEIVTDEGDDARPVVVLFSNSSHPDQSPDEVFDGLAHEATGPTDFLRRLVIGAYYLTHGGNHRPGDAMFALVQSPYGDAEEVLRADFSGEEVVLTRRPNVREEPAPRM